MDDRKEKIRKYKETPKPMGIVRIRNLRNGKCLVEASRDVAATLNRHQAQLRMGMHPNAALLRDWNAEGAQGFAFEVLDTLEPADRPNYDPTDDLRVLEAMWLERLDPFDERGYNQRKRHARSPGS